MQSKKQPGQSSFLLATFLVLLLCFNSATQAEYRADGDRLDRNSDVKGMLELAGDDIQIRQETLFAAAGQYCLVETMQDLHRQIFPNEKNKAIKADQYSAMSSDWTVITTADLGSEKIYDPLKYGIVWWNTLFHCSLGGKPSHRAPSIDVSKLSFEQIKSFVIYYDDKSSCSPDRGVFALAYNSEDKSSEIKTPVIQRLVSKENAKMNKFMQQMPEGFYVLNLLPDEDRALYNMNADDDSYYLDGGGNPRKTAENPLRETIDKEFADDYRSIRCPQEETSPNAAYTYDEIKDMPKCLYKQTIYNSCMIRILELDQPNSTLLSDFGLKAHGFSEDGLTQRESFIKYGVLLEDTTMIRDVRQMQQRSEILHIWSQRVAAISAKTEPINSTAVTINEFINSVNKGYLDKLNVGPVLSSCIANYLPFPPVSPSTSTPADNDPSLPLYFQKEAKEVPLWLRTQNVE